MDNKFGQTLKELRKEHKLTQQGLADLLGLSKDSIVSYELGRATPSFSVLIKLEKFFNVSSTYMAGETTENNYNIFWGNAILKANDFKSALDKLNRRADSMTRYDASYLYQAATFLIELLVDDELSDEYYNQFIQYIDELASYMTGTLKHLKTSHSPTQVNNFIQYPHIQHWENMLITLRKIEELYMDYYKTTLPQDGDEEKS